MTERIFNFSAGPAVLPVPVLEEAQRDMLSLPGVGMSVMEISHRSKTFDEIIARAESGLRELLNIPDNYKILFLQGGASLQFSMIPMNFLPADGTADYVITGSWGKKALKEAKKAGSVNVAATMAMATNRQAMLDEATVRNVYSGHSALAGQQAVQLVVVVEA